MSPWLPWKPCAAGNCRVKLPPGGPSRCETHREPRWDNRPSSSQRGYGERWRQIRVRILARDGGFCVTCKSEGRITVAAMVDHITPKHLGGGDDEANLRAICRGCHDSKTGREGRLAR